jgi:hypothetical protein
MNSRAFFESLWSESVTAEEARLPLCRFAAAFQPWAETLVTPTLQHPTLIGINQAKILLLDKYLGLVLVDFTRSPAVERRGL